MNIALAHLVMDRLNECFLRCNRQVPPDKRCEGGFFCLLDDSDLDNMTPMMIFEIGRAEEERRAIFFRLSLEKVRRLKMHREHLAAAQSQDEERLQCAGAVRACGFIFSFSGFPGQGDDKFLLDFLDCSFWQKWPGLGFAVSADHHRRLVRACGLQS